MYSNKNYIKNKDKQSKYAKKYYEKNKRRFAQYASVNNATYYLKKKYNMTWADYYKILDSQNLKCPICMRDIKPRPSKRMTHIDHCHRTGKVRGILCSDCNKLLGMSRENIQTLKNAISYIRKYQESVR